MEQAATGSALAVQDWVNWLRTLGRAETTVTGYAWEVRSLVRASPQLGPFDFRERDLTRYLAERRLAGCGDAAIKRGVAAFRSFFGYVCGKKSPAKGMPLPRVRKQRPTRTLRWDALMAVVTSCDTATAHGARDLALVCVLVDTGLRAAEVCRLRTVDVDLERLTLTVRVKGGELGQGVFCAATAHYVRAWLAWRDRIARPETATLFVGIGGLKTGTGLTTGGLRAIFRRIASRTGMTGGFSPHDLRRSMANLMTRLNSPERVTQVAGRWDNTRSMRPYTEDIDLEDARRFSPVAALMGRRSSTSSDAEGSRQ